MLYLAALHGIIIGIAILIIVDERDLLDRRVNIKTIRATTPPSLGERYKPWQDGLKEQQQAA